MSCEQQQEHDPSLVRDPKEHRTTIYKEFTAPDDVDLEAAKPDDEKWLTEELVEQVSQHFPCLQEDIDSTTGNVDLKKLGEAAKKAFVAGMVFCNVYQLKQYVELFAQKWGFIVSRHSYMFHCHYRAPSKQYTSTVSPSKQRDRKGSVKKAIACPWRICFRETRKMKRDEKASDLGSLTTRPVLISGYNFCHTCAPGVMMVTMLLDVPISGSLGNESRRK
jgi:hypothetical protein